MDFSRSAGDGSAADDDAVPAASGDLGWEERFRLFIDHSPAIAWIKEADGRYVYANRIFEERFGLSSGDWYGKTDADCWPEAIAESFRRHDLAVLACGAPQELEEESVDRDGRRRWWRIVKIPFQDSAGKRFVGGIGIDLTERKRAEHRAREAGLRLQLAMDAAGIGIHEWNARCPALIWDARMAALWGVPPGTAMTLKAALAGVHRSDRARLVRKIRALGDPHAGGGRSAGSRSPDSCFSSRVAPAVLPAPPETRQPSIAAPRSWPRSASGCAP